MVHPRRSWHRWGAQFAVPAVEGAISGATEAAVGNHLSDDPGIHELYLEACALAGDEITITINQDNDTTIIDGGTP